MGAFEWSESSAMNQLYLDTRVLPDVNERVQALSNESGQMIADAYQQLYRALNPDLTHVVIGQVGITQPIYVGGRLKALYDIASTARDVAEIEADDKQQALIVSVDEAYWRVVNVSHKKQLAEQYYNLLDTLEGDVEELLEEGLVTQSDLLKVKAKRGEAEVKKMQAENAAVRRELSKQLRSLVESGDTAAALEFRKRMNAAHEQMGIAPLTAAITEEERAERAERRRASRKERLGQ